MRITDQSHYEVRQLYQACEIGYDEAIAVLMAVGFGEKEADDWLFS